MKINRNDPCPCGSGKKYKHCCMEKERENPAPDEIQDMRDEIRRLMEGQDFASIEHAQAALDRITEKRNTKARDYFHGLSPEQMYRFLNFPMDSPDLVTFAPVLGTQPTGPITTLFHLLAEGIGEKGMKPTAKGNLPQKFCRDTALRYHEEYRNDEMVAPYRIRTETDFFRLHVARIVSGISGLIRKNRGRFILGRECRGLLADHGLAGIYPRLFQAYVSQYNWGYPDGYPDLYIIQQSYLFTLYLLVRYGDQSRPNTFYEDCFLNAFPRVLDEVEPRSYSSPEGIVRSCYRGRCLLRFAGYLGLADVEPVSKEILNRKYRIKKRPLLDAIITFHL